MRGGIVGIGDSSEKQNGLQHCSPFPIGQIR
jgi:hypothetical protein